MTKDEIANLALEIGEELRGIHPHPRMIGFYPTQLQEFATRFLAAVDAERGKEAVAWIDDGMVTARKELADQWKRNGFNPKPLGYLEV